LTIFRRVSYFSALIALLLTAAPSIHGQTVTTGTATAVVTDASGAVVPGAEVTIKYTATNESRSTVTDETGRYRFPLLKPGDYTIDAQTAALKSGTLQFSMLVGQGRAVDRTLNGQGDSPR
jgi:uncharacterized surface anchored protein